MCHLDMCDRKFVAFLLSVVFISAGNLSIAEEVDWKEILSALAYDFEPHECLWEVERVIPPDPESTERIERIRARFEGMISSEKSERKKETLRRVRDFEVGIAADGVNEPFNVRLKLGSIDRFSIVQEFTKHDPPIVSDYFSYAKDVVAIKNRRTIRLVNDPNSKLLSELGRGLIPFLALDPLQSCDTFREISTEEALIIVGSSSSEPTLRLAISLSRGVRPRMNKLAILRVEESSELGDAALVKFFNGTDDAALSGNARFIATPFFGDREHLPDILPSKVEIEQFDIDGTLKLREEWKNVSTKKLELSDVRELKVERGMVVIDETQEEHIRFLSDELIKPKSSKQ